MSEGAAAINDVALVDREGEGERRRGDGAEQRAVALREGQPGLAGHSAAPSPGIAIAGHWPRLALSLALSLALALALTFALALALIL